MSRFPRVFRSRRRGEGLRLTTFCSLHRFGESLGEGLRDLRFTSPPSESLGDNLLRFFEEFVVSKGRNDADVIRASDVIGDDVTGGSVIVTGADVLLVDVLRSNFVVSDVTGGDVMDSDVISPDLLVVIVADVTGGDVMDSDVISPDLLVFIVADVTGGDVMENNVIGADLLVVMVANVTCGNVMVTAVTFADVIVVDVTVDDNVGSVVMGCDVTCGNVTESDVTGGNEEVDERVEGMLCRLYEGSHTETLLLNVSFRSFTAALLYKMNRNCETRSTL